VHDRTFFYPVVGLVTGETPDPDRADAKTGRKLREALPGAGCARAKA
jgi:hypothetical protein